MSFEIGYYQGYDEGRNKGYDEGFYAAVQYYESRLSKYWAELQTLNARIAYLEKLTGGENV